MIDITIPECEMFNEVTEEFVYTKRQTITLEHSLVSLSKWESKWKKPFLKNDQKTPEEMLDYVRCMTITRGVDPNAYYNIPDDEIKRINAYIDDRMTATTFSDDKRRSTSRELITSELIYYWMVNFNIPFDCEKWHLNRLLTLIKICSVKSQQGKGKTMSKNEIFAQNNNLNALRRKQLGSKG